MSLASDPEEWGDIWASTEIRNGLRPLEGGKSGDVRCKVDLKLRELVEGLEAPKLHLGCGEKHLHGYVNVDFPPERHSVMHTHADVYADLTEMDLKDGTVAEIRLHHVFEHFGRVTALALLIRWHRWLRVGGKLHIETPDIIGSARTLLSEAPYRTKASVVRHLAGDQTAEWGYHVDHWFPERFERTLEALGFQSIRVQCSNWEREPYLSNLEVTAIKKHDCLLTDQFRVADQLLWESTVADAEKPTHEIWRKQLRHFFDLTLDSEFTPEQRPTNGSWSRSLRSKPQVEMLE